MQLPSRHQGPAQPGGLGPGQSWAFAAICWRLSDDRLKPEAWPPRAGPVQVQQRTRPELCIPEQLRGKPRCWPRDGSAALRSRTAEADLRVSAAWEPVATSPGLGFTGLASWGPSDRPSHFPLAEAQEVPATCPGSQRWFLNNWEEMHPFHGPEMFSKDFKKGELADREQCGVGRGRRRAERRGRMSREESLRGEQGSEPTQGRQPPSVSVLLHRGRFCSCRNLSHFCVCQKPICTS